MCGPKPLAVEGGVEALVAMQLVAFPGVVHPDDYWPDCDAEDAPCDWRVDDLECDSPEYWHAVASITHPGQEDVIETLLDMALADMDAFPDVVHPEDYWPDCDPEDAPCDWSSDTATKMLMQRPQPPLSSCTSRP
eukprot:TRINITY_DN36683_c0_g1_i1.p1 TRINITY_DN36683_c0_g1~~TRINITY_DN36683_c0_g1_i1.p1  ORF type:complete len:135 (-),score=26.76 TRINITY_DN36683_c0_g1_i1:347-751(-)